MKIDPKIYHTLSWTWGIIMTAIGALVASICRACGLKPKKHAGATYFEIGEKPWGGISLGCFFFCSKNTPITTKDHEFGHSLQNAIWGPLFPFVIGVPSFIRCQKFNYNIIRGIPNEEDYYSIWYEGQASEWGKKTREIWPDEI